MQLPIGWEAIEVEERSQWCATLRRGGERYEVDAHLRNDQWVATVTQVRRGQRHRIALVQRPTLTGIVQAAEDLLPAP